MANPKHSFRVEIRTAWCKGCRVCVAFCPTNTLEMRGGVASVARPEACTGCGDCVLRCPDFAIEVRREELAPANPAPAEDAP